MLKKWTLPIPLDNKSLKERGDALAKLQRRLQQTDKSALVIIDGWEASGKGYALNELVRELDPRYYEVRLFDAPESSDKHHSYLWRYMRELPRHGRLMIFDRSQYYELLRDPLLNKEDYAHYLADIRLFENLLIQDDTLVLKYFLHHSQKEMHDRVLARRQEIARLPYPEEAYRHWCQNDAVELAQYDLMVSHFERVIKDSSAVAPWHVVDMSHQKEGVASLLAHLENALKEHLDKKEAPVPPLKGTEHRPLNTLDLTKSIDKATYKAQLSDLQEEAAHLLYECYLARIPVIAAFEGTDAAGKGGTIQRLTRRMDPRGYDVATVAAPTPEELSHHYLWRFYRDFPVAGKLTIFDRTWYGRVLVERLEHLTPENRLHQAYDEICGMEESLVRNGIVLMKFLLVISKDEQKKRFNDRAQDPEKNYKLTPEDWRNHEKYDEYINCYNDMVVRTDKPVPWTVISSEDKRWARIKVLTHFNNTLRKALKKRKS